MQPFDPAPSQQLELQFKPASDAAMEPEATDMVTTPAPVEEVPSKSSPPDHSPPTAVLGPGATMARLLELVSGDEALPVPKRRNVASSIRKFVQHMGLDLLMPASFPTYRGHLRGFNPASAHISKGRWANIRSDVSFALKRYGAVTRSPTHKDLRPAWRLLREALPTLRLQRGLSRLMHWCSAKEIAPEEVDDVVMTRFHRHLIEETFEKKPDRIYRDSAKLWNQAVVEVPGWPDRTVSLPSFRNILSLPLEDFPVSFQEALDRYALVLSGKDLTAPNLPAKPLEEETIEGHLYQLRRFASAMVKVGRPIGEIDGLGALLEAPWFEDTIQAEFDRLGGKRPCLQEMAGTLLAIARHHLCLPKERIEAIKRIKQRLKCRPRGFTEKNRERLRSFTSLQAQARFLYLGEKLRKLSAKATSPMKTALMIQTALAHELLIAAPMRFGNLVELNLRRHFRFPAGGNVGKTFIVIYKNEVKNDIDLEFELPSDVVRLLKLYLDKFRPSLVNGPDEGWLFPGEKPGTRKHQVTLSGQLVKAVGRHAGLTVNPHLYRHIAAYFFLQAHPGEYETVRRLLGHKSIDTTVMFYADFERSLSIKRYHDVVLERKGGSSASKRKGRKKETD